MASRKLGGGRILGSGKSLAPPTPPGHKRTSSLLSPSESTASLDSQTSTSPLATSPIPDQIEDLGSRVSVDHVNGGPTVAAAMSQLVCPICNEEMMTLLQLNRHLDDNHQELPEIQQHEVKNWFEKQVVKAKKFQPLAVINQKLKGLETFESNGVPATPRPQTRTVSNSRITTPEPANQQDPDELVTRAHWQRHSNHDLCTEPSCGKRLGSSNGSVNCRKCGRLFCDDHTMYQMKLSRSAQHEPLRGFWCRVCETCYKSREGYNDHNGLVTNHLDAFVSMRKKTLDKQLLEISRLEKRLTKLTQLLANPPSEAEVDDGMFGLSTFTSRKDPRKSLEQSVVVWEEDARVSRCPFCQQDFGSWTFRRHHCRMCGRVVCADPNTGCSSEVGLNVNHRTKHMSEKFNSETSVEIRMCKECKTTIFSRKDFEQQIAHKPPDQKAYEHLLEFERGIRTLLASFQKSLVHLQDPDNPPTSDQLTQASRVRTRLLEFFGKYDVLARRIRDLPTTSPTQIKLQKNIHQQASNFLHLHMLPLKSLPKILKHASPHGADHRPRNGGSALASVRFNDMDSASQVSSSSAVSQMEAEEKELRERLIVLEEQKFIVSEMVAGANKRRKFDEVASLSTNVDDLSKEIDQVNGMLAQLDFEGAYGQAGLGTGPRS